MFAEEGVRSLSLSDAFEESEPPEPLPPFVNHWLDDFTSWTTDNKLKALDAIIPLYVCLAVHWQNMVLDWLINVVVYELPYVYLYISFCMSTSLF